MTTEVPVDLVVNCYERTYRTVLSDGFFNDIAAQNDVSFAGKYVVINNVDNREDAKARAESLVATSELLGFSFVADTIAQACAVTGVTRRMLTRPHPYLLDFGLVMAVTGTSPWLLGWDAEVRLHQPRDWVSPAVSLMSRRDDVFSAAPRWPARQRDTLEDETVARDGDWCLNCGFSDQVFLVRRHEVAAPIYRRLAPAAWARHAEHPWTLESRLEAYQRASRRLRATHSEVRYGHNDLSEVVARIGGRGLRERLQHRALAKTAGLLQKSPTTSPAWHLG